MRAHEPARRADASCAARSARPPAQLVATRDTVALDGDATSTRARSTRRCGAATRRAALAACPGELLGGFDEDWAHDARQAHARAARRRARASRGRDATDPAEAVRLTREQVALDPLAEEPNRRLIERLARRGRSRGGARRRRPLRRAAAHDAGDRAVARDPRAARRRCDATPAVAGPAAAALRAPARDARSSGRAAELARLRAAWAGVRLHGDRRLVLVAGEPGVGKTRLALDFAREAHDARRARARRAAARRSRWPPTSRSRRRCAPAGAGRRRCSRATTPDDAGARHRLFDAVDAALAGLAAERRLLLVSTTCTGPTGHAPAARVPAALRAPRAAARARHLPRHRARTPHPARRRARRPAARRRARADRAARARARPTSRALARRLARRRRRGRGAASTSARPATRSSSRRCCAGWPSAGRDRAGERPPRGRGAAGAARRRRPTRLLAVASVLGPSSTPTLLEAAAGAGPTPPRTRSTSCCARACCARRGPARRVRVPARARARGRLRRAQRAPPRAPAPARGRGADRARPGAPPRGDRPPPVRGGLGGEERARPRASRARRPARARAARLRGRRRALRARAAGARSAGRRGELLLARGDALLRAGEPGARARALPRRRARSRADAATRRCSRRAGARHAGSASRSSTSTPRPSRCSKRRSTRSATADPSLRSQLLAGSPSSSTTRPSRDRSEALSAQAVVPPAPPPTRARSPPRSTRATSRCGGPTGSTSGSRRPAR